MQHFCLFRLLILQHSGGDSEGNMHLSNIEHSREKAMHEVSLVFLKYCCGVMREREGNGQTAGYMIAESLSAGGGQSSRLACLSLSVMATMQHACSLSAAVKIDL